MYKKRKEATKESGQCRTRSSVGASPVDGDGDWGEFWTTPIGGCCGGDVRVPTDLSASGGLFLENPTVRVGCVKPVPIDVSLFICLKMKLAAGVIGLLWTVRVLPVVVSGGKIALKPLVLLRSPRRRAAKILSLGCHFLSLALALSSSYKYSLALSFSLSSPSFNATAAVRHIYPLPCLRWLPLHARSFVARFETCGMCHLHTLANACHPPCHRYLMLLLCWFVFFVSPRFVCFRFVLFPCGLCILIAPYPFPRLSVLSLCQSRLCRRCVCKRRTSTIRVQSKRRGAVLRRGGEGGVLRSFFVSHGQPHDRVVRER